jgi:uncharacterized protein HemX
MTTDASEVSSSAPTRGAAAPASAGGPARDARAAASAAAPPRAQGGPGALGWLLALAAIALAAAAAWYVQDRIGRTERELARRMQDVEVRDQQRDQQVKLLADTLRDSQAKAALLEARLAESLGQQLQLRQLYDEMARNRGDLVLADVENSILIAAQQLQLGGNVQSALLALQDAEQVLARSNQPAMIGLRRTVARDIERLKALPLADFAAAVNRLDAVIGVVEQMPLLADVLTTEQAARSVRPEATRGGLLGLPERMARTGLQGWDAFVAELRSLFRVQRVDHAESMLLAPDQRFFVRETLRLQLLNARLNLLARNESLFRADLGRAIQAIERNFDPAHKSVASALAALRQLQATRLAVDLPSLAESIGAVRAARAASDAR